MTKMERISAALMHTEADRVPVYPIICGASRRLTGVSYPDWSTDAKSCAEAFLRSAEDFDSDCIVTLIDLSVECDGWGQPIIFPENEAAHPDYSNPLIRGIEDYANIKPVDFRKSSRMMMHIDVCKRLVEAVGGEMPVIAFVFGPLGVLSMMRGQQDLYLDLYDDPDTVKSAVGAVNETLKEYISALCDTGVSAIMLDTLFASGSIMSKEMWWDAEGVFVRELADVIDAKGCLKMIHNCGDRCYFDMQIKAFDPAAISFLYPPDDCADFAECKAKYGGDLTLIGCVTPANAVIGTEEEWDSQCRTQIDAMAPGGGFVLATGCEYPANADFIRAQRMIDIANDYGRYDAIRARSR